jgi:hypothetical protein
MLLDQYGAADVIVPEVRLRRQYPGGPATATFTARHGPDNHVLGRFSLRVSNSAAIPRMLDEGVRRLDLLYAQALDAGLLAPDPTLIVEAPPPVEELEEEIDEDVLLPVDLGGDSPVAAAKTFSIQVDTPTADAVGRAELSVSRVRGVTSALTTSLALGGTSTMRVTYMGDSSSLQAALEAQGWTVRGSGTSLRISRGGD